MKIYEKLMNLGYPENIKDLILNTEGVSTQDETDDFYIIWDNYEDNDRFLQINKKYEVKDKQFKFFSNTNLKREVLLFVKELPPILLMNFKRVFFIERAEDIEKVEEESPNQTFSMNHLGMAVYNDSTIFINLALSKTLAKEEFQENMNILGYSNKSEEQIFTNIVLQTLAHELYHLAEQNPLIEEYVEVGEEYAEAFCHEVVSI